MAKKAKDSKARVAAGDAPALTQSPFASLLGGDAPAPAATPMDPGEVAAPSGARFAAKVVVRREKKGRGGKTVTRISGIAAAHRAELAARMKKSLGCGATREGEDVVLLGSLVDRAADWLEGEGARRVVRAT